MSWEMVRLGDVCTLVNGRAYKQKELLDTGTPVMRIQNLNGGNRWYYSDLSLPENKYCDNGDLLYAWSGSFGPYIWAGSKAIYHYHIWKILPGDNIDKRFLFHVLDSITHRIKSSGHGIALIHVTKTGMEDFEIPLPPLPTQKKIVEILDCAQGLIDTRKKQITQMDQLVQSLFYDMFGDPVKNPKGWDEAHLDHVANLASGVTKGRKLAGKETVSVPYMRVANVQDGYLKMDDITEIEVLPSDVERYRLVEGDILLTEGGDPDKLGRGAVWLGGIEDCIHQNHIFRVRLQKDQLLPAYAAALIGSARAKRYFLRAAKQTTGIASINMTQLKKCPMLLPPITLQNKFASRVEKIEAQKAHMVASLKELEDNFNSLMQRAFKGELG